MRSLPPLPAISRRHLGHRRWPGARTASLHQLHTYPAAGAADSLLDTGGRRCPKWAVGQAVDVMMPIKK